MPDHTPTYKRRDSSHYLAILRRRFPSIAARVESGEISVYQGTVEAGIRRPASRKITLSDEQSTAVRIAEKLGPEYAAKLADELRQTVALAHRYWTAGQPQ